MKGKRLIYALCCPVTKEIHYIGKSSQGLVRPKQHLSNSHSEKISEWVKDLKFLGKSPDIKILKYLDDHEDLDTLERYFVDKHMADGAYLLNHTLVTPIMISQHIVQSTDNIFDISEIANFVKARRKQTGLSQEEFADRAGVALTVIRKIEQNDPSLSLRSVQTVIAMFGGKIIVGRKEPV